MRYAVSIVFDDLLYRLSLSEGESAEISSLPHADFFIPDFRHVVILIADNGAVRFMDTAENGVEERKTLQLDHPCLLDASPRIELCVSEESGCSSMAGLGEKFTVSLGRGSWRKDGIRNDIALTGPRFVSRSQIEIVRKNGKTTLKDLHSTNGTFVNGKRVNTDVVLCSGDRISILTVLILYEEEYLRFENIGEEPVIAESLRRSSQTEEPGKELFKRSTRITLGFPQGKIAIPPPPANTGKPEISWLSTLLPAGVTIAIAVVMSFVFKNNSTMMIYSIPMTVAGVLISVVNYFRGEKTYREELEEKRTVYQRELDKVSYEIKEKREAQKKAMLTADPSPEDCLAAARFRTTALWCREPEDADFASVRLGTGTVPFSVALEKPREQMMEEADLRERADEIFRTGSIISGMPVLCDVRDSGTVGLLGTPKLTKTQLQNMIFHLAANHCCTELKIVCFYNEKDREELSWLADLPHTHGVSPEESYLADTKEKADKLFRSFTELLQQRKNELQHNYSYGSNPSFIPYILFAFFEPKLWNRYDPINQYLFEQELDVGCLMTVEKKALLPKKCTAIISLSDNGGEIYNTADAYKRQSFLPDVISPSLRRDFGRAVRPLYSDEGIVGNSLPKSYTFYEMLGISSMSEFNIGETWKASDLRTSELAPSAPFGILENGDQVYFSSPPTIKDGGAHALIAGTAGAGKSELLLTLIVSLALRYPPEEVSFLIIDFKGDGVAGSLKDLPHLRGVISNIDITNFGVQALDRSLSCIRAEIERREGLFKAYNDEHPENKKPIKGIRGYTSKYRQGMVTEPLPHLFIIVDEFAEMRNTLPLIMADFVSAASKGRSSGVHLILATQSPSGVVDNKILANTLKQLCLKVANTEESRSVIGRDLAANIENPGRGYLKIDDNLQLFQSAFGGCNLHLPDGSVSTQIREAIDAMAAYCRSNGIRKLPDIFCPPLPERIVYPLPCRAGASDHSFGLLPVGIRDDPSTQFMGEYCLNVFSQNTLIVGSQKMGKTNLLMTILRGVAESYSPEEVNVYILDSMSFFLKCFEKLPHVGGVVTLQETDMVTNMFRLLNNQIKQRNQKFGALGIDNFTAYLESGARDLPQILLLVDDLAALQQYFSNLNSNNDPMLNLCKAGVTYGISVVATATQPVGSSTYLPEFSNRIALYNNNPSVYGTLLNHNKPWPEALPGRCLVAWKNAIYMCQSFLAFDVQQEIDRAQAVRSFCRQQTEQADGKHAANIPFIPKNFPADAAFSGFPEAYSEGRLMFGLDYETVAPLSGKLAAMGSFALSGQENDVRNFQRYMLMAAEKTNGLHAEFYIVDGISRALQPLSGLSCVAKYSFLPEMAVQLVHMIKEIAEERYSRVANGDLSVLDSSSTLVLMLNSNEAINAVSSDKAALTDWTDLTGRLKTMNICVVFGELDNAGIPYAPSILSSLRTNLKLVFFEDLSNIQITGNLQIAITKKYAGTFQKGDGYLILGSNAARIRVPDCPLEK